MQKMSNLNDMMVFLTVVEQGSFTKAANAYGLPKSNISRKITRLEEKLSVKLLERSTRSLHLTEIGQVYFQHCQRIFDEMQSANTCIETLSATPRGIVKLCTSVSAGQGLLADSLADFCQKFPQVKLDISLTNRRVDVVEEGFDVVIRVGQSPDSSLISKKLCTVNLNLYASPNYIKQYEAINHPDELSNHNCLWMSGIDGKPQWPLFRNEQKLTKTPESSLFSFNASFSCDDFMVIKKMAINGAGITMLPDYLCQKALSSQKLARVLPNWRGRRVDIYAIYPSRKGVTPKIRVLLDFLAERLANSLI